MYGNEWFESSIRLGREVANLFVPFEERMSFEKQLGHIKDRAELKAWIDDWPDDVQGLIIVKLPDDPDDDRAHYRFREIGPISIAEANYMVDAYKWLVFKVGKDD